MRWRLRPLRTARSCRSSACASTRLVHCSRTWPTDLKAGPSTSPRASAPWTGCSASLEASLERERIRRRAVRIEMLQALPGLFDRRCVTERHPPQRQVRSREALEPLTPATEVLDVVAAVGELEQRVDRLPDRHVDDDQVVVEAADRHGVARVVLQPPDESG